MTTPTWWIKLKGYLGRNNFTDEEAVAVKKAAVAKLGGETESQAEFNRSQAEKARAEAELIRVQAAERLAAAMRETPGSVYISTGDWVAATGPGFARIQRRDRAEEAETLAGGTRAEQRDLMNPPSLPPGASE